MTDRHNSTDTALAPERDVTILIPAYNEADALGDTLDALKDYSTYFKDVLVVDDGSTDATGRVAADKGARVVRHARNRGYGASLKTGAAEAGTPYVLMFDADGQHPADAIPRFVEELGAYEVVIGRRVKGSDAVLARRPGKWVLGKVANRLAGERIPDLNCGMRLVRTETLQRYGPILPDGFSLSTTMTIASLKDRLHVKWVDVKTARREGRASNVRFFHDGLNTFLLILRVIMLFDPLKIFLPISVFVFFLGAIDLLYEAVRAGGFQLSDVAVFCFLTATLVFLFGLVADQLAALRKQLRE